MEKKTKVVIEGGTGYLGQHLLQAFAANNGGAPCDVAFTHHYFPLPRRLLDAFPHFPAFPVDLKSGLGFRSISQNFCQVSIKRRFRNLLLDYAFLRRNLCRFV